MAGAAVSEGLDWVGVRYPGCCVFKPGGTDRLDAYGTGGTCDFDALPAQAMVHGWDHPCRYENENCDKLHVSDDLQILRLDFARDASYLTIDHSGVIRSGRRML